MKHARPEGHNTLKTVRELCYAPDCLIKLNYGLVYTLCQRCHVKWAAGGTSL